MSSGYEQIYESLIPKLSKCDFLEVAERLGLSLQPDGTLSVQFLGREYEISSRGVNPTDGKPVNVNNRSVLAYYTLSQGMGEPEFSYVPISYHTGAGIIFSEIKWMTDPLGKAFNENYEAFSETMDKLGGVFNGKMKSGGYSWLMKVLPKIPLQIIYQDSVSGPRVSLQNGSRIIMWNAREVGTGRIDVFPSSGRIEYFSAALQQMSYART